MIMGKYLGETEIDVQNTEYSTYNREDWAMLWIKMYGGIDGAHHKDWVLDHVARILKGTKVIIKIAKWGDGVENTRFSLDEPTLEYHSWVTELKNGEDGPETYGYDIGIAP
jgi:hypothetical protein